MSPSLESGHDDQLVRYVLGLLPEEEAELIDELSIADDEVAARLRVVEDDLVDAYVRGRLEGETLERFETFYLSSPRRREKVTFARRFRRAIDLAAPAETDAGRQATPAAPARAWRLTAAAVVAVTVGGTLLLEDLRLRRTLGEARQQTAALDRRANDLQRQLDDARVVSAPQSAAAAPADRTPAPTRTPPALVLLPQTRAAGEIATLTVPAAAERIAIDLRLDSNDFSRYQAALRDPATGQIAWRSGWIGARTAAGPPSVSVAIPGDVLKPQHYAIELSGRRVNAGEELVASYAFEVVRH